MKKVAFLFALAAVALVPTIAAAQSSPDHRRSAA